MFIESSSGQKTGEGQHLVDSLQKVLKTAHDDTNKVKTLIDLSKKYSGSDLNNALKYANEAIALSDKLQFANGKGFALKSIGIAQYTKGNYADALEAWKAAMNVFIECKNQVGEGNMLSNIGAIYFDKGLLDSALDYGLKALKVAEEAKDTFRIASALGNVGNIYSDKNADYDKSLDFYKRALMFSKLIKSEDVIGTNSVNIAEIFYKKYEMPGGDSVIKMKYLDSALGYISEALKLNIGSTNISYALKTIGDIHKLKKEYLLSINYYMMAYDTAKKIDQKADMAKALVREAEAYKSLKDYKKALELFVQAQFLLKDLGEDSNKDLKETYEGLASTYSLLNDYKDAYHYDSLLSKVNEEIYNIDVDKKLGTKLFAHDLEKKQGEINLQEEVIARQKLIKNGFIVGFMVVLGFSIIFLQQKKNISKQKKNVEHEKERSEELLLNILPADVAEELKNTGEAKVKSFDSVTVLFTDFKGFTQISEKMTAEELVAEIDYCFRGFDAIISKYGIEKIKTIGDSYMCAGGVPKTNATHPKDVVNAAIEIRDFIIKHKAEREAKGEIPFEVRIGVNTGPVVAGIVGVKKFAYDIWGDAVNFASRMESSGEPGKVNISGATFELVKDEFNCSYRGKVMAKGKGEVEMYFVEKKSATI